MDLTEFVHAIRRYMCSTAYEALTERRKRMYREFMDRLTALLQEMMDRKEVEEEYGDSIEISKKWG